MTAGDEIAGKIRILRQEISGNRPVVVGERSVLDYDQTSVANQLYINGGAPSGAGRTIAAPSAVFTSGQKIVVQIKPTLSGKQLDSDAAALGLTNATARFGIVSRDLATGVLVPKVITDADRSTTDLADDPTFTTAAVWYDALIFSVPLGETWQLYGETNFRSYAIA